MEDEQLKAKYEKISPIKGIGLLSFAVIIAETNGFALFNNQCQLVSYAGYDVVENQSGKGEHKKPWGNIISATAMHYFLLLFVAFP
ncbi:MAG: transposase [Bacteroidota bacterium]